MLTNCPRLGSAITAHAPTRTLPMLLAELVELGREAWRINEQERAVRAEIEVLYEIAENDPLEGDWVTDRPQLRGSAA